MAGYFVPASRFTIDSWVKNSHFISTIGPAFSVNEAREAIAEITQVHTDAAHNVPAYLIGYGSSVVAHSSDNGEPSGTAGRPALSVLSGSGLGDVVLVITRYFGGTKLGTGGLVKAYGNAARLAVSGVKKAKKVLVHKAYIECQYNLFDKLSRLIRQHNGLAVEDTFTDKVRIEFSIPVDNYPALQAGIQEESNGLISIIILERDRTALQVVRSAEENNSNV